MKAVRGAPKTTELSARELQCLVRAARGMTNRAIAEELQVAEDTVKSHMRHVFQKFDVADRAHAVHRAWELGVLPETAVAS